jgi:hypothetical protein
MRKNLSIALAATLFGTAATANAQGYAAPFGAQGQVTFAAERLFGFHWVHNSYEEPNNNHHSSSGTSVGIGWNFAQAMQFNQARLGIDFFVAQDISLGGALGFFSANSHGDGTGVTVDGFIVSPRVGFNVPLSQSIVFWPKVGLTFLSVGDNRVFGLSGEANFVFFPRPSWGFIVAPTLDLAPFGSADRNNAPSADLSSYSFGVSAGILGVL